MASESYYHPIRECGILVILLLFPVGREYNGEGQGLMQFISCNSVTASPLSFLGSLFLNAGTATSIRTPPHIPKKVKQGKKTNNHEIAFITNTL